MAKNKYNSTLEGGQVLKDIHEPNGRSIRVHEATSEVPSGFTNVELTTNSAGSVTRAVFYGGTAAERTKITFVADVAGSLNNKYFTINAAENRPMCYVWYNVDSGGTDPAISGLVGIEVPIVSGDAASTIALATKLVLDSNEYFTAIQPAQTPTIIVTNAENGIATASADGNTGFTFATLTEGVTEKIKTIILPFDNQARYLFNKAEGTFIIEPYINGELSIVGLSNISAAQQLTINTSAWTAITIGASSGTTVALNIQNESSCYRVRVNSDNTAPLTEGMLIAANLGERQYLLKTGTSTFYLVAEGGSATVNIEVIS